MNHIPCALVGMVLTALLSSQPQLLSPENYSTYGTLVGALGNANGVVVFTDSRASFTDASGAPRHLQGDFQKLIQFNDTTVCAIAGLGSARVHVAHELDADLLGVVESFRDELQNHPKQSILTELTGLSASLTFYLNGIAEVNAHTGFADDVSHYHLALLLVGFDLDGLAKIGELSLRVTPHRQTDGSTRWQTSVEVLQVENIQKKLTAALTGMWDVADDALKRPEKYGGHPILEKYRSSMNKDQGASMAVDDLEELGRTLTSLTTEKYPEQVGGQTQIALLRSGESIRFVQPNFPPPKKPFRLVAFIHSSISPSSRPSPVILLRGNPVKFYEATQFIGPSPEPGHMELDGGIFVGCTFANMVLWYNGGPFYLDSTDKFDNSELAFGIEASKHPDRVRELQAIFAAGKSSN